MTSVREVVLSSSVTMIEFCGACPVVMMPLSSNRSMRSVASGFTAVEPPTNDSVTRGPCVSEAGAVPGTSSTGIAPAPSVANGSAPARPCR